jgi:hypothetical protein
MPRAGTTPRTRLFPGDPMPLIETMSTRFRRMRTVNATDNGFPSRIDRATAPPESQGTSAAQATSSAVLDLTTPLGEDMPTRNVVMLVPYGAGSDTNTFSMRVIGWTLISEGSRDTEQWRPMVLGEFLCTLSTQVGLAGRLVANTDRYCDTIALVGTTGNDDVSIDIVSPANDTAGHVVVDMKGAQKLEVTFTTGGSATSCNCLVKMY